MSSDEGLARLKSTLENIDRENTDRMSLIEKRAAKALEESKEATAKLVKTAGEVLTRLNERNQRARAAGGWATEAALADKVEDDGDFGFEDDEEENERRAGYKAADPLDSPLPTSQRPIPPPPLPVAPPPPEPTHTPGRHRHRAHQNEEDDYANTDWLEA
jgi:hypothetical protein